MNATTTNGPIVIDLQLDRIDMMREGIVRLRELSPYDLTQERFLCRARQLIHDTFSSDALLELTEMKVSPMASGVALIRGIPVTNGLHELPQTPADGGRFQKDCRLSEAAILGLASVLGEPYAFASEKQGDLIHTIAPISGREQRQANDGSVRFASHVEHAFRCDAERPDMLLLLCLRPDHDREARTTFTDLRDVLSVMDEADREVLREPLFQIAAPQSTGELRFSEPRPVVFGPEESPSVCFNLAGMKATRRFAQATLDRFAAMVESPKLQQWVCLDEGDLLILNNRVVAHGRSDFMPRYDGYDRCLQRVFVKYDLGGCRSKLLPGSLRRFA